MLRLFSLLVMPIILCNCQHCRMMGNKSADPHVFSRAISKISASLKSGVNPEFTILSELNDPAAFGAERVILKGVKFTTLNLINWELGVLGEQEMPFSFDDWAPTSVVAHN